MHTELSRTGWDRLAPREFVGHLVCPEHMNTYIYVHMNAHLGVCKIKQGEEEGSWTHRRCFLVGLTQNNRVK